jgi:hypothetical protein
MLAIGIPGPFDLIMVLSLLANAVAVWLIVRAVRSPSHGPRGFDVDSRRNDPAP